MSLNINNGGIVLMERNLFVSRKSLIFQIQRMIYDKWRYTDELFVHRKTFQDYVIIQDECYFHVMWRCFFIQDLNKPKEEKYYANNYQQQETFINLIVDDKLYVTKMKELYGKVYNPLEILQNNQQSLTEIFYFTPLNLDNQKIKLQLQKIFLGSIDEVEQMYSLMNNKFNIGNYNLSDIGVVSKFVEDDKLSEQITSTYPSTKITDRQYKLLLWNILNSSIIQIDTLEFQTLFNNL